MEENRNEQNTFDSVEANPENSGYTVTSEGGYFESINEESPKVEAEEVTMSESVPESNEDEGLRSPYNLPSSTGGSGFTFKQETPEMPKEEKPKREKKKNYTFKAVLFAALIAAVIGMLGGVGPMTIATLMKNTLTAAKKQHGIS